VDTNFFKPYLGTQRDNIVLTVGMFHPFKRQDVIIKLFEKYIKGNYRLIVAGTILKSHSEYYHKIRKLANQDRRVTILENVSDSELKKLYQIASVYCHARRWEHFGVPIIEAMASGTPVVAMKGGGLVETVINFETGFLADNTSEFVKWLKYLLENPFVRLEMGKRARRRVKEKFSVNVFAEKLEGYLMGIIR
jgi:glycosyltransferase involved in cell wall biosynthesis